MHTKEMEWMYWLIAPALLAAWVLLMPLSAELKLVAAADAITAELRVRAFPFSFKRIFRLHLLKPPYFSVDIIKTNGEIRNLRLPRPKKRKPSVIGNVIVKDVILENVIKRARFPIILSAELYFGVKDDAAASVLIAGTMRCLLRTLLPLAGEAFSMKNTSVRVEPVFGRDLALARVGCMVRVRIADIISIWIKERGKQHDTRN